MTTTTGTTTPVDSDHIGRLLLVIESFKARHKTVPDCMIFTEKGFDAIQGLLLRSDHNLVPNPHAPSWMTQQFCFNGIPIRTYPDRKMCIYMANSLRCDGWKVQAVFVEGIDDVKEA